MSNLPIAPRPRRASRAPSRLGDENGLAATTTTTTSSIGGPRLMNKSSANSVGAVAGRVVGKAVGVAASINVLAGGKSASVVPVTRRALGDVSNAGKSTASSIGVGLKDNGIVKPRSRVTSAGSNASTSSLHPPSSTGTGFSRLKIGATSTTVGVAASKASRVVANVTRSSTVVKDDLLQVPRERDLDGLGVKTDAGQDWTAQEMYKGDGDAVMDSAAEIPLISVPTLKRSHDGEQFSDVVDYEEEDVENEAKDTVGGSKVRSSVEDIMEDDPNDWVGLMAVDQVAVSTSEDLIDRVRDDFDEPLDYWDTTMVAEYSEEIFAYMSELEDKAMPNPRYMDHQTEIEWSMRTTLIDWLLQVHARYHMLPETLWIAINLIDRFLSNRVVSLVKFQLVGVTAMFIAAKYEEIMAPSVEEFVYMTESGYTKDEIIKGERIILQSLEFNISPYCSPYSWVRRISKADDYDIQTRTLSKFLMEVTLLDHRFLRAKPSMIAAIGMYLARRMLGGAWNEEFIYYSNYTEPQLVVPTGFLLEAIIDEEFEKKFVYKKYANKKFLKASIFARNWAKANNSVA